MPNDPQEVTDSGKEFLKKIPRHNPLWRPLSGMTLFVVGAFSKFFIKVWHNTTIYGLENLENAIKRARKEHRGIITFSNHTCKLDDPLIWGALNKLRTFARPSKMRWTMGAHDVCFKSKFSQIFFFLGQTLPVKRFGAGPDQPAIDAGIQLLNEGRWVHIYPEGYVHQPLGDLKGSLRYFKWGISRLLLEPELPPLIVPIYTSGLEAVFPEDEQRALGKGFRKKVEYVIGEPINDAAINEFRTSTDYTNDKEKRSAIAKFLNNEMLKIRSEFYNCATDAELEFQNAEFWVDGGVDVCGLNALEKRLRSK